MSALALSPRRRGACPALSAPMVTGDGLLVRLSPRDRALTAAQLAGVAEAAERFGNGLLEVTARGKLQVRGLTAESALRFAEAVAALGIAADEGLAVETGALAGLNAAELADPRPIAEAIRRAAAGLRLAPKVAVVVDGGGRLGMGDVPADVRLVAVEDGWAVTLDGGEAAVFAAGKAVAEALRHLQAIAALGDIARGRDVSPAPTSSSRRRGSSDGLVQGGDGGGRGLDPRLREDDGWWGGVIGIHRLRDGRFAVGVGLAFGQVAGAALVALAIRTGAEFRLSPGRAILAINLVPDEAERVSAIAADLGFVTRPDDPRLSIAACAGAPACASGGYATQAMAAELVEGAAALLDGSVVLHLSGCAKGCAHPGAAALTLVGEGEDCVLVVGDGLPVARLPRYEAAAGLRRVARLMEGERGADDAAAALARLGWARIAEAFGRGP
jgi:precorrin-3B synthase